MSQPLPAFDGEQLRILIVDDDRFQLELLTDMLCELGDFAVRSRSDARSALLALAESPHLLICDLSMPDMDGIEFMHAASLAGYPGKILLLSGMDSGVRHAAEHLALAHGLQVIGTYQKPITHEGLKSALSRLLETQESGSGNSHNLTPFFSK